MSIPIRASVNALAATDGKPARLQGIRCRCGLVTRHGFPFLVRGVLGPMRAIIKPPSVHRHKIRHSP